MMLDTDHEFHHHGLKIPDEVIRQLQGLTDVSVHRLSPHEVRQAHMNFLVNGSVLRDANGDDLHDMLHLHWGEEELREPQEQLHSGTNSGERSFVKELLASRQAGRSASPHSFAGHVHPSWAEEASRGCVHAGFGPC